MKAEWVDGFEIRVTAEKGETVISANREGMLSLAKQLRIPPFRLTSDPMRFPPPADIRYSLPDLLRSA